MKKEQKVRVLADNRIGIVADSHFINWGGKRWVQHQVKFPNMKGDAPWFPAEKLTTNLVEKTTLVINGEKGSLTLTFSRNHDKGSSTLDMVGNPENLKEHKGTHMFLATALVEGLTKFLDLKPSVEVEAY